MSYCSIKGCDSYTKTSNYRTDGITFHRFPKDAIMRSKWLELIKRKDWLPNKYSVVCSRHFEDNWFVRLKDGRRRIFDSALPTQFLPGVDKDDLKKKGRKKNWKFNQIDLRFSKIDEILKHEKNAPPLQIIQPLMPAVAPIETIICPGAGLPKILPKMTSATNNTFYVVMPPPTAANYPSTDSLQIPTISKETTEQPPEPTEKSKSGCKGATEQPTEPTEKSKSGCKETTEPTEKSKSGCKETTEQPPEPTEKSKSGLDEMNKQQLWNRIVDLSRKNFIKTQKIKALSRRIRYLEKKTAKLSNKKERGLKMETAIKIENIKSEVEYSPKNEFDSEFDISNSDQFEDTLNGVKSEDETEDMIEYEEDITGEEEEDNNFEGHSDDDFT